MLNIVLIALGLSMDAFAVSVSAGICAKELKPVHALRGAFFFGSFQFLMPVVGWYFGSAFRDGMRGYDHWIAFGLLALVGGHMVKESLEPETSSCDDVGTEGAPAGGAKRGVDVVGLRSLVLLSVATSLDALAVGFSFSLMGTGIWSPAALIGGITFAVCLAGFEFGKRIGSVLERRAETAGGLVLIGIGLKILIEHLTGGA